MKKMNDFWEDQAEKHGFDVEAVNYDPHGEDLEMFVLQDLIEDGQRICDLGCGNGRTVLQLAEQNQKAEFVGVDSSASMIEVAETIREGEGFDNVTFHHHDAREENVTELFDQKFDIVITKRLLINVQGEEKLHVIDNIDAILKHDGVYLMIECFLEPLKNTNDVRELIGLSRIEVKRFNEYLTHDFFEEIDDRFDIRESIEFGSFYYFISRVFNAYLADGEPNYHTRINKLAVELSKQGVVDFDGYGPEVLHILEKP